MVLSKSEYIMFLKHPAWLWLKKHDKSKLPQPDAQLQAMFDTGHLFEEYAEQLFPSGTKLGFKSYEEYLNLPYKTQQLLDRGTKTIFQGRLEANSATCIFDILEKVGVGEYDLIEIKSSTRAKSDHEYDLAFQLLVLESSGVKVGKIKVLHVNKDYIRKGSLNLKGLTNTTDITQKVRALESETKHNISRAFEVMASSEMPSMSPRYAGFGATGEWLDIYRSIEGELGSHHIYNIVSPNAFALGQLEDLHIENMKDIPDEFNLKPKQQWQVTAHKTDEVYMDKAKIKNFLKTFKYPLYFLDYETLMGVLPPFDGLRPYQQLPFQYSLHILDSAKAKLKHYEYLHTQNSDPTQTLLKQLKKDIGTKGTVIVWNESFEKSCNDLMGEMQPEYTDFLKGVNKRVKDLMIPFSKGWFVDKEFIGSASLKNVFPTLVKDISYADLNVQEGTTAQSLWMETFLNGKNQKEKAKITKDLIEYCKLDTLAMVKILDVLQKSIKQ